MDREGDMGTNSKRHVGGVNLEKLGQSKGVARVRPLRRVSVGTCEKPGRAWPTGAQ